MVWRRALPIVLMLVVAATPLAADVCRVECERQASAVVEPSCHEHAASMAKPIEAASLSEARHLCDHDGDQPAVSAASYETLAPGVAATVSGTPVTDTVAQWRHPVTQRLRLVPPLLKTPLRV